MYVLATLLHGCESWSLTADDTRKIEVFHHRAIRKILRISIYDVQRQRIRNSYIRKKLDVRLAKEYIARRQLKWIQKLASEHVNDANEDRFHPSKLLFGWTKTVEG